MVCFIKNLAPPPPPPFPIGEALNINNSEKCNLLSNGGIGKKPLEKKVIPVPAWDGRSELLKAIRDGKLLSVHKHKLPIVRVVIFFYQYL